MAGNHIQDGSVLQFTAGADIASGDLVIVGQRVGVALDAIANGDVGVVRMEGVFEVPKEAALAVSQGDLLYCNTTSGELDKTATAQTLAGYAFADAAGAAATVLVKLNA